MCMCSSDGPRAGPTNEFTLPMWHCCDNQIPCQACAFPLEVFVCVCESVCECWGGQSLSLFTDKDITFPYSVHVRMREEDSKRKTHDSTAFVTHQRNSLTCLNPYKWDFTWTHTHRVWAAHSACHGLITLLVVQSTISVHRSWLNTTRQLALPK